MLCGEVIEWEADCSHGHFKKIGQEIRERARKNTERRRCS